MAVHYETGYGFHNGDQSYPSHNFYYNIHKHID
jgi:hypothetical protein